MSETAPEGYYVYQPDPPQPDGRIYAIGGLPQINSTPHPCERMWKGK